MRKLLMIKDRVIYIFTIVIGAVCLSWLFPFMVASPYYFSFINHDPYLVGWSWLMFLFNYLAIGLTIVFAMVCFFSKKNKNQFSLRFDNILIIVFYFGCAINFFFAVFVTTSANGDLILHPFSIANYYYSLAFLIFFVVIMIRSRKLEKESQKSEQ